MKRSFLMLLLVAIVVGVLALFPEPAEPELVCEPSGCYLKGGYLND